MVTSLVAGGAGFLGSHLINALIRDGERVIVVDDLSSGHVRNLERAIVSGRATFIHADVAQPYAQLAAITAKATKRGIDRIFHFAAPGSAQAQRAEPWATLAANALGTMSLVELALAHEARFLFASSPDNGTGEPLAERSFAPESKRFGEAAVATAVRSRGLDGRIVRFFHCYGPAMGEADGRLVPELIESIRARRPLPIHGSGQQKRSPLFVDDAIALVQSVMASNAPPVQPVDAGHDDERSVEDIARTLSRVAGIAFETERLAARERDCERRSPDLGAARALGWAPSTSLEDGLRQTYRWFCQDRLAYA